MSGKAKVYVDQVEFYDLTDTIEIQRLPLDADGDLIEDREEYDWTLEVSGTGDLVLSLDGSWDRALKVSFQQFVEFAKLLNGQND